MVKDRYGYLMLLFILALILFACTLPAEGERMPGEYVLGEDGSGPIDVFWAGEFDDIYLYRLRDIETGASCYVLSASAEYGYERPAISCIFDPLTPRG